MNVAYYYQSFAWLREFGVVHGKHLQTISNGMIRIWEAIEPFVKHEREAVKIPVLGVFESSYKSLISSGSHSPGRQIS